MGIKTCETCRYLIYSDGKFDCERGVTQDYDTMWDKDCEEYYYNESYP